MGDNDSMCERILQTIANLFKHDQSQLQEFTIIPTEGNILNKSPICYEPPNLGLESWCIKHVYCYASTNLLSIKKHKDKSKYKFECVNHLLIGALLINPDVTTFWNIRRELIESDESSLKTELHINQVALSYKPKSLEAYAYRRWLLNRLLATDLSTEALQSLRQQEDQIYRLAAERSPNNYHVWAHRFWFLEKTNSGLAFEELNFIKGWIESHVSEHCSYHYRAAVINHIQSYKTLKNVIEPDYDLFSTHFAWHRNPNADSANLLNVILGNSWQQLSIQRCNLILTVIFILLHDLDFVDDLIQSHYKDHESLWYYRRFILFELVQIANNYQGNDSTCQQINHLSSTNFSDLCNLDELEKVKEPKLLKGEQSRLQSCILYRHLCENEAAFIRNLGGFSKINYSQRHVAWLKLFLGINLK